MLINLRVKTLDAQTHDFSIDNELTIREFKDKIAEKTNISADQQRIIYCGRVLADEKQLKEYDVDGKVVHVAERPPPSQRGPSTSNSSSNDTPNTRERTNNRGMRNSPLFRALDGMVVGTMAIPMNPVQNNGQQQVNPFAASSSFCMNRITVARHMLDCANNIAAYLEDPERGLNNTSLDILARGSWTMESTVVEVGFTAADLPQNQNIVEMVQDAVSAALRRNSNTNVTVVQLPTVFGSNEGEAATANGSEGVANMDATESTAAVDADVDADGDADADADAAAAVIIEDVIDDAYEGVAANISLASDTTGTSSTSNTTSSTNTTSDASTTDISSASTTTGTNTEENPSRRRTNTRVLAEVVEQMRTVQTRLNPFIQQFYELLNNDPTYEEENTTDRDNAQRLYNRVSEALHYMSHAQHAISDLMLDISQPAPRFLTCRPILVEQSGYVSSNNYLSAAAAAAAAAATGNNQQRPRSRTTFISPRRDHAVTITTLSPPTTASGNANSTASGNTPVTTEAGNNSGYVSSNSYLSAAAAAAAAAATGNNQHRSRSRATFISPRRDHAVAILSPPTTASGNANRTAGGNTAVAAETGNTSGGSSSAGSGGTDGNAGNNRNSNSTTASASGSGSGSSIDDPVDEPLTNPNATSTAAAANAATQSNDDSAIEIMLQPRRGLYFGNNPQVQMSRLIQAMVNSAPINTELHVQILPPTILSVPVNARGGNNGNGEQQQRATAATNADATATAAANNSNNNANANATGSSNGSGSGANANNNHSNNAAPAAGIVLNPNSGYRPVSASLAIGTLPTTSTQTRSTSRPQLQIGGLPANGWNGRFIPANMMSSFDRFLPCNSHHIREPENGNNGNAANASAPSNGNGNGNGNSNASMNNATPRIITTNTINPHSLRAFADLLPNVRSTPTVGGTPSGTTRTNAPPPPPPMRPANHFFSLRNLISGQNRNPPTAPTAPSTSGTAAAAAASSSASSSAANTDNYRRNLRTQLLNFVNQRIFGGGPINEETMSPAVNRAVDWFDESLELLTQYEKPEYDSRHSVVKLLRHMLPLFIDIVRDEQTNLAAFEQRIKRACEDFVKRLYSVLYVCVGRNNAQQYWVQLMRLLWVPTRSYFRGEALRFLSMYINTVNPSNTDTADVQQYIVHRDVPSVAQTDAPLETDVEMVEVASTSEANPHSQFSIDIDDDDDDVELELAPAEPLPNVSAGSEPWHRNFPTDWLPIITHDLHTQSANPTNQTPFSDAYISGMSAKRRKMLQDNKPPTDINALVARSVRKAIQTVGPRASTTAAAESLTAEEITEAIANDATVHTSFRDAVRTNVRERLQKDTNYKAEKFPHTAKFVNK